MICPDCKHIVNPIKDYCEIHKDCQEYAYICPNCHSLNLDYEVRQCILMEHGKK